MNAHPQPVPPDDIEDPEFEAEIQEGIAAADAGRVIPWNDVRDWMMSWGTDNELPAPGQSSPAPRPR